MRLSSRLLEDRNYKDLEYLYNLEKEKQSFLSLDEVAYLTWIHAIILFYTYNEKDKAIALLEKSMTRERKTFCISKNTEYTC